MPSEHQEAPPNEPSTSNATVRITEPNNEISVENEEVQQIDNESIYSVHQHHTTSMHRYVGSKTIPRNLEERRYWMSYTNASAKVQLTEMEAHANQIVDRMEQDTSLMEDTPESAALRREALRDMPQNLTVKRFVKDKLKKSVSQKSKKRPIGCLKRLKYQMYFRFSKFKVTLQSLLYSFELWYGTLKKIEGHFGSGTALYFKFLRWLFITNILFSLPIFIFVVIPQIIYSYYEPSSEGKYLIPKQNASVNNTQFSFVDIFTAEGSFTNSLLFYGFYTNTTISIANNLYYKMPDAYFFSMSSIYIMTLLVFCFSVAKSYRTSFIQSTGGMKNVFAHKIFCGWDYSIATTEAADLKCLSIYQELKELLYEMRKTSKFKSCLDKFWTFNLQFISHVLVGLLLSVTVYGIWFLLGNYDILTAIVINVVTTIYPLIFSVLMKYEDYKNPKTVLFVTLARIFSLEVLIIGELVAYWIINPLSDKCWETSLAQEIYRLIIFDFLFSVLLGPLLESIRFLIYKKFWVNIGAAEFDIARHTIQLIYNQALFWVGFYFSPLLSFVVILKLLCTWYIRKISILYLCKPSTKLWRSGQAHTWFMMLSFICLLLTTAIHSYVIFTVKTSNCGPFSGELTYYVILTGALKPREISDFLKVVTFITKPGVVTLILLGLCVIIYYQRAKAQAQIAMVKLLKAMLVWEAKDKEFLLQHISKVTKGKWQYNLQDGRADIWDPIKMKPIRRAYEPRDSSLENSVSHQLLHTLDDSSYDSSVNSFTNPKKYM